MGNENATERALTETEKADARQRGWEWPTATFFGAGRLRPGPGSWASLAALGLWAGFARLTPAPWHAPGAAAGALAALAVGVPAATRVERQSGQTDPGFVVIDEVCGQLITLVGAPFGWKSLLAGFILFRVFDILKPPPLRRLERFPGGVGIMLDDVGAGFYALLIMRLLSRGGWI
jgi:phosphatidylglycerophosphatase A